MAFCRAACFVGSAGSPAGTARGGAVKTTSGGDWGTTCCGTVVAAVEGGSELREGSY